MKKYLNLLLCGIILQIICPQFIFASESCSISGTVYHQITKKPLTGVVIIATSETKYFQTVTDRYGKYNLQLDNGNYTLQTKSYANIDTTIEDIVIKENSNIEMNLSIIPDMEPLGKYIKGATIDDSIYIHPNNDGSDYFTIIGKVIMQSKRKILPLTDTKILLLGTKLMCKINNSDGKFEFKYVKPAEYNIKIVSDIAKTKLINIKGKPGDTIEIICNTIFPFAYTKKDLKIEEEKILADSHLVKDSFASGIGVPASSKTEDRSALKEEETKVKVDGHSVSDNFTGGASAKQQVSAGKLTSGELNDFRTWDFWKGISANELIEFKKEWQINPNERYCVQLTNDDNMPVVDCEVSLITSKDKVIWTAKTDNTGKAELWNNLFINDSISNDNLKIQVNYNNEKQTISNVKKFKDGINFINIKDNCNMPSAVDIVFAVDATGSMSDEINYLKAELDDIILKIKNKNKKITYNLGSIFYRDLNDEYLIEKTDLSANIDTTIKFINTKDAAGGGDYPEAVDLALETAVNDISWNKKAISRIVFLILDAPPHNDSLTLSKLKEIIARANIEGIRIVPVVCSGSDRSNEYLMRSLALATNGTYVFLTNHSGIGDAHLEPITQKYDVELLNKLFIRLIEQFSALPICEVKHNEEKLADINQDNNILNQNEAQIDTTNSSFEKFQNCIKFYPNPTKGNLNIEVNEELTELYIVDIAGKILYKLENISKGKQEFDLGKFPTGLYFLKYNFENNWGTQKILLVH